MTPEVEIVPPAPRTSVVIVTYNRRETLSRALKTLGDGSPLTGHQVIVVDNGSSDGTASELDLEFPAVRVIRLPKNFGLTKALNLGIRAADGTYILLLHDDTFISGETVAKLADYLEDHPEAGAAAPLLTDESGQPAPQVRRLPTAAQPDPPYTPATPGAAESLLGAAVMYRAFFLRAIRQIDERYGNYGSAVELSWQVNKGGKKNVVVPDLQAVHLGLLAPVKPARLAGDRAAGTATFLGTHVGLMSGLLYRLTTGIAAIFTLRMSVAAGVFAGQKIDGTN